MVVHQVVSLATELSALAYILLTLVSLMAVANTPLLCLNSTRPTIALSCTVTHPSDRGRAWDLIHKLG